MWNNQTRNSDSDSRRLLWYKLFALLSWSWATSICPVIVLASWSGHSTILFLVIRKDRILKLRESRLFAEFTAPVGQTIKTNITGEVDREISPFILIFVK